MRVKFVGYDSSDNVTGDFDVTLNAGQPYKVRYGMQWCPGTLFAGLKWAGLAGLTRSGKAR